jgi:hypothetical protein
MKFLKNCKIFEKTVLTEELFKKEADVLYTKIQFEIESLSNNNPTKIYYLDFVSSFGEGNWSESDKNKLKKYLKIKGVEMGLINPIGGYKKDIQFTTDETKWNNYVKTIKIVIGDYIKNIKKQLNDLNYKATNPEVNPTILELITQIKKELSKLNKNKIDKSIEKNIDKLKFDLDNSIKKLDLKFQIKK